MTEVLQMLNTFGPWGIIAGLLWKHMSEIKPALDRNTEALGMVAQLVSKKAELS
jgi:hypothetical protein